jgi:Na+/melibiose symporter-like transporter
MRQFDQGLGSVGLLILALALGLLIAAIPPWNTATYGTVAQILTAIIAISALLVASYSIVREVVSLYLGQHKTVLLRNSYDYFYKFWLKKEV